MAAASPGLQGLPVQDDLAARHLQPGFAARRASVWMNRFDIGVQPGAPDFRILHQPHFILARVGRGDTGKMVAHRIGADRLLLIAGRDAVFDGMIQICSRWQVSVGLALNSAWTMPEPALMRWISPGRMVPPPPVESLWAMAPSRM